MSIQLRPRPAHPKNSTGSGSDASPRRPRTPRRPRWRLALALVAAIAVVVAAVLALLPRQAVEMAHGERLPLTAPEEWDGTSTWSTPALLVDAGRVLTLDQRAVAFVTASRDLAVVDAASGQVRWSARLPEGKVASELRSASIDGAAAIAAQIGSRLAWWDCATGKAHGVDLPDGARVSVAGSSPLVTYPDGHTVAVIASGTLATLSLPQGATAWAARGKEVTAAAAQGWWHLRPGAAPGQATPWTDLPAGAKVTPAAFLDDSLISVVTGTATGAEVLVTGDAPGAPSWHMPAQFSPAPQQIVWWPSPSRRWGVLDRTLIDLESRKVTDLGTWHTQLVSSDRAMGVRDGRRLLAGPQIAPVEMTASESIPEDLVLTNSSVSALVRGTTGTDQHIYLLPLKESR